MATQFKAVQDVLNTIVKNWTAGNGGVAPDLVGKHGTHFKWDTCDDLLASKTHGLQLIQPEIIGKSGKGATANLVLDLTVGAPGQPPMPDGGLDSSTGQFLSLDSTEITTIIAWIEDGCLP